MTAQRSLIINIFQDFGYAVSNKDILDKLPKDFDRVTLYRTLKSFEDKGLLHVIPDPEGEAKYALCNHDHTHAHGHDHSHAHFKCTQCHKVICLPDHHEPQVKIPSGYTLDKVIALATGTCDQCS